MLFALRKSGAAMSLEGQGRRSGQGAPRSAAPQYPELLRPFRQLRFVPNCRLMHRSKPNISDAERLGRSGKRALSEALGGLRARPRRSLAALRC